MNILQSRSISMTCHYLRHSSRFIRQTHSQLKKTGAGQQPNHIMGDKPKFYNAWFCPFAQRAWIALLHKGVDFEYIEQDPYNKTPEWLAIHPDGLVPAIVHNGKNVYESSICIEYIDEAWPEGNSLLPKDPHSRAFVRMWGDHIGKKIIPPFYAMLLKSSKEEREEAKENLLKRLGQLFEKASNDSPFLFGKEFGMLDIMLVPWFLRFYILKEYRQFEIPQSEEYQRMHTWFEAVQKVESVKGTLADEEKLLASYKRYEDATAESMVADAILKGKAMP